jgi:NitT/TauT family transport system permease protein/taurine transport system permease protein
LVAAELVGANSGLGFLINDARTVLRTDFILAGMLAIGLIGLCLDRIIRYSAKTLMPWARSLNS